MKVYHGNYLGLVVNSTDPEYRGRVQVFVPHVMPAIYEGWNEEGQDIEISCVGSNIPEGLTPEIHARLVKILPWAEAASPIIGSSAPGNLFSEIVAGAKSAAGAAYDAVAGAAANFFNQGPTSNPVVGSIGDVEVTNQSAAAADATSRPWSAAFISYAAKSADPNFTGATTHTGYAAAVKAGKVPGWSALNPASAQIQPGDIVIKNRQGNNLSFNSNWTGSSHGDIVVSNTDGTIRAIGGNVSVSVTNVKVNPSETFAILRPPQDVAQKMVATAQQEQQRWSQSGWKEGNSSAWGALNSYWNAAGSKLPGVNSIQSTAAGGPAGPNPLTNAQGEQNPVAPPQPNLVANPEAGMTGTISGGGTVSNTTGFSDNELKFAMRIAAGESGAGILNNAYSEATDPSKAIANTYFKEYQSSGLGVKAFAQQKITAGAVDWKKVDIGYVQSNEYDKGQKGAVNTGSYKDQIVGTAQAIRNLSAKNPALGSQVTESIKSGNFAKADEILGSRGGGSIGTKYYALKDQPGKMSALEERINKDFGGDVNAALDGINNELPPVPTVAEISSGAYDPNALVSTPNRGIVTAGVPLIVNNTDSNGRTPVINTNDMASGLFSYPNPGAMVWVFFREGNPLFPVYFAASYSSAEWKSAYRGGSPAEGYTNDGKTIGRGTVAKFGEEGGILTQSMTNMSDALANSSSLSLFHQHGSNITMKDGCDFYFSRNNKRDEVDNDRFIITKGYKEEWIEGDASTNTRGNLIVKVGNISAEAIAAMQELSDMSYEMNQTLMNKPKSGGGSSPESSASAKAFQKAVDVQKSSTDKAIDNAFGPAQERKFIDQPKVTAPKYLQVGGSRADLEQMKQQTPPTVPGANTVSKGAYSIGIDINKSTPQATNSSRITPFNFRQAK